MDTETLLKTILRKAPLLCLLFAPLAILVSQLACAEDEVTIKSEREKLHALKAEVYKLEDQFFSAYNKLNDVPGYEVRCSWENSGMYKVHACRPAIQEWAEREAALGLIVNQGATGGGTAASAANALRLRTPAYQKHLVELVEKNPQLLKVLEQRAEAQKNYDQLWTKMHKGKFWVWD